MKTTEFPTMFALHRLAAARGDGLHPKLLEALSRTGSISGPPPAGEAAMQVTVVYPDFRRGALRRDDEGDPTSDRISADGPASG